jgi:hypothetical protein
MKARLIAKAKEVRDEGDIVEIVIWQVPVPVAPCHHDCKYRLFFGQPAERLSASTTSAAKGTTAIRRMAKAFTGLSLWISSWLTFRSSSNFGANP